MGKKLFEKSGLLKKLKSIKHIEVIIAILFALIILLVFFSSSGNLGSSAKQSISAATPATAYAKEIENKLESIITKLDGAGNVSVMVMCDENTSENNSTPKIVSAVVVSSGASDVFVKLNIIKTVEALLNLDTKNIEVLSGK